MHWNRCVSIFDWYFVNFHTNNLCLDMTILQAFQFWADQTLNPRIDAANYLIELISFDPNLYPTINLPNRDEWIHDESSCTFGGTQLSLTLVSCS